jgi:serine/threonine-protein kinase
VSSVPVTATGELVGTPGYLAPERVVGEQATSASDLYALGMVAYECLSGAPPFTGPPLEVALAHRDLALPPLPSSVAADVGAFVMQLTAKDPAWRPDSAADVAVWAGRLREGLTAGPGRGPYPGWVPAPGQPPSSARLRHRMALACASIAIAAIIGLVLASLIGFAAPHQAAAHQAAAPASSRGSGVVAQPSTNSGRPPAGSPAIQPKAASSATVVAAARPGHKQGHRHGRGNGNGHGHGHGHENGNGNGNGNGNVQTLSTSG